ncbi:hypothetical protein ACQBAT_12325 [Ornithinimicrobium sp. Y1847]|uniref:hypothetical protein n=1 Tax=unclassified Ornithinimicrobium TaxID=2615080 RepID=UPI003B67CD39
MNSRRALAGLVAILPLALLLLVLPALPPPLQMPSRWARGEVDTWTDGATFLGIVLAVVVVAALLAAASAILQRMIPPAWSRWVVALSAAVGWLAFLTYVVTVWRIGVDGPEGVSEGWLLLELLGAALAGVLAYVVHGRRRPTPEQLAALIPERARVQAVRGRSVRPVEPWSTEVASTTLWVIGWVVLAVFALMAVLMVATGEGFLVVPFALVGVVTSVLALAWARIRIEVDEDGLAVRSRVLPVRLSAVPAAEVAGVEVRELDPMKWGGKGLRALPERTAYIVDGGPGIVIYKRDGRRLALQITEGDAAARDGARSLLRAAGQRLGESSGS